MFLGEETDPKHSFQSGPPRFFDVGQMFACLEMRPTVRPESDLFNARFAEQSLFHDVQHYVREEGGVLYNLRNEQIVLDLHVRIGRKLWYTKQPQIDISIRACP